MDVITFKSADCLISHFESAGTEVGPRSGPHKRTQDAEGATLDPCRNPLRTVAANELLNFPLSIEKCESPDFLVTSEGTASWGLEITEATTQAWQRELTAMEKNETHPRLLRREGWRGNSAEREACAAILRAMRRKARKIKRGKYRPALRHDILIYVNMRAFFYDVQEVIELLSKSVTRWRNQWDPLGQVHVLTASELLVDVTNNLRRMPLVGYLNNS